MRVAAWLHRHDPGYGALRRAGRAAIVMPLLFLVGGRVLGSPDVALFGAFGAFAMLLFVDFGGPLRERVQAEVALAVVGAVLVCLGTLASDPVWLSAAGMALVALVVLFAGSVSSVIASAGTALLLAFILPVMVPGTIASLGPRLLGWGLAAVVSIVAITVLWPAPTREPLRGPAVDACRALAARLRAESAYLLSGADPELVGERDRTRSAAEAAVAALHGAFLATPYRPTGLSTPARTIVRLVDEIDWLDAVFGQLDRCGRPPARPGEPVHQAAWAVKSAAADALDESAVLLAEHAGDPAGVEEALGRLAIARADVERATLARPFDRAEAGRMRDGAAPLVSALDPGFRAQELAYAVATVAGTIALTARAERRTWWQRLVGRQPGDLPGPVAAAAERATGFVGWNSVWLRNSIRGAIGLGLAVLLAKLLGVEHSFWVVLGTLSVLRSNALSTGQTALRGVLGTAIGVAVGAAVLFVIGGNPVVLWIVLPAAILVAGFAPAAISFAAGQAAFTLVLVLVFNIIAPSGWTVGLVRIEDIALGCAVSLVVGLLFWPRGASASLRRALADAYREGMGYLAAVVTSGAEARAQSLRAAAASRRLDDAFRTYLAERGAKSRPLAEVSASVSGVAGVRLAGDAIQELWAGRRAPADLAPADPAPADPAPADPADPAPAEASALLAEAVARLDDWYGRLGAQLAAREPLPQPSPGDPHAAGRLEQAVLADVEDGTPDAMATAVRMIWTADYLEVVRRLQAAIVPPARVLRDDT